MTETAEQTIARLESENAQLRLGLNMTQAALGGTPSEMALAAGVVAMEQRIGQPFGTTAFGFQVMREALQAVGRVVNEEIAEQLATGQAPSITPAPNTTCLDAITLGELRAACARMTIDLEWSR